MSVLTSNDDLVAAQQQQGEAMKQLEQDGPAYSQSVVLVRVMKERIEALEMKLTAEHLKAGGGSAAASKIMALADERYAAGMKSIIRETTAAQERITRHDLLKEKLASCREIMANERKKMGL